MPSGGSSKRLYLWKLAPRCCWCRRTLAFKESTLDHLRAKVNGGGNALSNLVIACGPCNSKRGSMDLTPDQRERANEALAKRPMRHEFSAQPFAEVIVAHQAVKIKRRARLKKKGVRIGQGCWPYVAEV